jgi:hypothetical protein
MAEREEGPDGIAGVIRCRSLGHAALWHSGTEKKAGRPEFRDGNGNLKLKPGFDEVVF